VIEKVRENARRAADLRGRRLGCDQAGGRPDPRVLRGRRGPV